ncbi:MAG: response regulator [Deltaproteobacteria bacterium]|nr:response regulator [Deltaproteobacteria bacterium]
MEVRKRILLVEDNPDAIDLIRIVLEHLGYNVTVAKNGKEGVDMATEVRPDLIVMDILMPVMDGFQAISRIRENPQTRAIPILAATVLALPGDRERCLAKGCNGYISKPFTHQQLQEAIKSLVSEQ